MSEDELEESDIYAVMAHTECTKEEAIEFLQKYFSRGPFGNIEWTEEDENK